MFFYENLYMQSLLAVYSKSTGFSDCVVSSLASNTGCAARDSEGKRRAKSLLFPNRAAVIDGIHNQPRNWNKIKSVSIIMNTPGEEKKITTKIVA